MNDTPDRENTKYVDARLTRNDQLRMAHFVTELRETYGDHWSCVFDLKNNIAQVLTCVYADTTAHATRPVVNIPFITSLSWRVTAIEREEPLYFDEVDLADPRSFYLRKAPGAQRLALFQVRSDTNIGLFSIFALREHSRPLSDKALQDIAKRCNTLLPYFEKINWRMEQEILDKTVEKIRRRETPFFICELFSRLLEMPIVFFEKVSPERFECIASYGLDAEMASLRYELEPPTPKNQIFFPLDGEEIFGEAFPELVTGVFLKPGNHLLIALGELRLRGSMVNDFSHYVARIEDLLQQPPYQISTLSFLLYLQHWMKSTDRDINEVFRHIINTLVPFLGADYGLLALLTPDRERMLFVSQAGEFDFRLKEMALVDEEGKYTSILGWVAKNNRPHLAQDVQRDPYYHSFDKSIRCEMCAPIHVRGEIIGMFSVSSKIARRFTSADVSKLCFFCDQMGVALFQAGILDRALAESRKAKKFDQEVRFGFHSGTHAKDLTYNFGNLIGSGTGSMKSVFEAIRKINGSGRDDLNVLITGETGTGKEMVSFALHNSSSRGKLPMVVANFASYGGDPNLIQSELFGHEKGSFSGASERRIGCIEQANGSTLLIDEVGDIVSSVQIKLLRVLQQSAIKTFQRLGGQKTIESNVRILAATHKDLRREVEEARFREDLFYRLKTLVIRIPPLRERLEDIPLLVPHFNAKYERAVPGIQIRWLKGAILALQEYNWPGNVRQLEAVINRAIVLYVENDLVTEAAIRRSLNDEAEGPANVEQALFKTVCDAGSGAFWELVQKPYRQHEITQNQLIQLVSDALNASRGSYKQAAAMMGVLTEDYNRFLDFLKNSNAKLDYREFRHR